MELIDEARTDISDINAPPAPAQTYSYVELGESWIIGETVLARETALAISYNGINQAVMMISPGNMEDFVRGFSLTNEIVTSPDEIRDIKITGSGESYLAQVEITNRAFWALKDHRRQLAGTSGCGICGVEALDQALPALTPLRLAPLPEARLLEGLRERINAAQTVARDSGALHAALYLDAQGEVRLCREDIGRHNALDKLIGAMAQARFEPAEGFVVLTSRCGLELIHKAVRARIGTLVSLSAPTALTVEWARRNQLNLIHLPHHSLPRLYSPAP